MIVKVQRPIYPADAPCLVYDKYRRFHAQVPMTPALRKLFGERFKIFCDVERKDDGLVFTKVVPDPGW